MTIATILTAILYFGGIAMVILGIRSAISLARFQAEELRPDSELRRTARIERIEDARKRRLNSNTDDAA